MAEFLSPGVYIEETSAGPRPIEGISTTTAAFVGFASSGPTDEPTFVANWQQFTEIFGSKDLSGKHNPYMEGAYLAHAVFAYFNNGGTRCYVVRMSTPTPQHQGRGKTIDDVRPLQLPSRASKAVPSLSVAARSGQTSDITLEVLPAMPEQQGEGQDAPKPEDESGVFTLRVTRDDVTETFPNVSIGKRHARHVTEVVNRESALIEVRDASTVGALAERAPEAGSYLIRSGVNPLTITGMNIPSNTFVGTLEARSGIEGLEVAEDVSMICVPDLMSAYQKGMINLEGVHAVQRALIDHCERAQNRMAILDTPPDLSPQQAKEWREKTTNFDSSYAAVYYPWIKIGGPDGQPLVVPPSGFVAGIYARSDVERGVHKAPANEVVRGALSPAINIAKSEQDLLNPIGVNCIRSFTGMGIRVWGARTLASDARWRYVPVRRLFNYIEKSIERGTQWAVFEPNDDTLWAKIRRDVTAFLMTVWREGALFGANPREAFYVKCDAEINPPESRDLGILQIEIGIAPVKPAEFIRFRFSQYAGGAEGA